MADTAIETFTVDIDQDQLDDLAERLARTRWPQELDDAGWDYGMSTDYLRGLVEHWHNQYDWRAHESRINALSNFTTTIDGQRIHFIHHRADTEDATPLILTHGWPGSIVEFFDMIEPLHTAGSTSSSRPCPALGSPGRRTSAAGASPESQRRGRL